MKKPLGAVRKSEIPSNPSGSRLGRTWRGCGGESATPSLQRRTPGKGNLDLNRPPYPESRIKVSQGNLQTLFVKLVSTD